MKTDNNESTGLPEDETRQDNPYWLEMWQNGQTDEFHQLEVNELLMEFWPTVTMKKHSRVLVPLCGKSLDMLWLAEQGCRVVGVELSPIAVKAFFSENNLKVKKSRHGNFTRWKSGLITIWCGDLFSVGEFQLGKIDCIFDRASLTALPVELREHYVEKMRTITDHDTPIFLLTVEEISKNSQSTQHHIDDELTDLYSSYFDIDLTHVQRFDTSSAQTSTGRYTDHKVYQLSPIGVAL